MTPPYLKPHMANSRPQLGDRELLVYGECECGWRMAAPEGSLWPLCPNCCIRVRPPKTDRWGYVADLMLEVDAVKLER